MNPQDDPEARIRDLERPLSDLARTSELGTGQYDGGYVDTSVPPPPTGYYGAPYGTPYPPRSSGGFPWWWLVLATVIVGVVLVGAGVAVFGTNVLSSDIPTSSNRGDRPSFPGGGGTLTTVPTSRPGLPGGTVPQAPTEAPSVSTAPPGESVSISGIGENKTIACNDNIVSVSGVDNTVVITGHCTSLTVSGMDNVITVDSADTIGASGFGNQITFHSGDPDINNSGSDNVVEQG
jgi:hypothetical protein